MQLTFIDPPSKQPIKPNNKPDLNHLYKQSVYPKNTIYLGDNIDHLRSLPTESVDFSYNDPPWNTKREHSAPTGTDAEGTQFIDSWSWDDVDSDEFWKLTSSYPKIVQLLDLIDDKKRNLQAYLVMISIRLVEIHRVLKKTGTIYVHCDQSVSHYLKLILDLIFGKQNFRNEITWRRFSGRKLASKNLPRNTDIIFRYTKSSSFTWNENAMYVPHTEESSKRYNKDDHDGKGRYALDRLDTPIFNSHEYELLGLRGKYIWSKERALKGVKDGIVVRIGSKIYNKNYLSTSKGQQLDTIWTDIPHVKKRHAEYTGYPTQKPIKLLIRLIETSTNPGDVILDAFCGSGTTCLAAEILHRRWIGIDVGTETIKFIKERFKAIEFWNEDSIDYK